MKLVAYDREKLGDCNYKRTKLLVVIEEFVESGMDCAKIEGWTHKNAVSCAAALNKAIKRYNKSGIRVTIRSGEVFLIKTE